MRAKMPSLPTTCIWISLLLLQTSCAPTGYMQERAVTYSGYGVWYRAPFNGAFVPVRPGERLPSYVTQFDLLHEDDLIRIVGDKSNDGGTRFAAATALADAGRMNAVPALEGVLRDDSETDFLAYKGAQQALGRLAPDVLHSIHTVPAKWRR